MPERKLYLSGVRIPKAERKEGYFYYAVRHTDSGSLPWRGYTLEPQVIVNHYADVVTNFEVTEITLGNPNAKDFISMTRFFNKYQPKELDRLEDMYV
jgi:hypothetical protein